MDFQIIGGDEKESDLEKITEINKVVFGETKTAEQIKTKLSQYKNPYLTLGRVDGETVGYGMGYEERGRYYFWMLGVLPNYRGNGIGSGIIEEQIRFAREKGYPKFLIKTSNKWKDMLKLVISKGFDIVGFKTNEWDTDSAIWLELDLSEPSS